MLVVGRPDRQRLSFEPSTGARDSAQPSIELRPQNRAPRPGQEPRLDEERQGLALPDRLSVEPLDGEPFPREPPRVVDEGGQRKPQPLRIGIPQRHERAAAALDEQGRPAAEQDDIGAGDASRACARPLRPRQDGSVRLRRIGGGEHERLVLVVLARPQLPQALDRAAERELGAAETLDEVAAPAKTERLERLQLAVDRAVAALDPLSADAVARDDPLPLEQELGERAAVLVAGEEAIGERPSALRRGLAGGTGAREPARPPFEPRRRRSDAPP